MTVGNTFSNTYLRLVNYFRSQKRLDVIEPEDIVYKDEIYDDVDDEDPTILEDDETSDDTPSNGDDAF